MAANIQLYKSTNGHGGAITATEIVTATTGNLFDTFSGAETLAGGTFYACFYIKNTGDVTAQSIVAQLMSETDHNGVNVSLAIGAAAVNASEATPTDENTAPAGVTFGDTDTTTAGAASADDAINLSDIPAGQHQAMWARMVIDAATTAVTGYDAVIDVDYDTAA